MAVLGGWINVQHLGTPPTPPHPPPLIPLESPENNLERSSGGSELTGVAIHDSFSPLQPIRSFEF